MDSFVSNQNVIRLLMFPWLGHGHISPFLELAKRLTARNFNIFLCSTPANLSSIRQKLSEKYSKSIQLVELHLTPSPDLPPHYHTTNGLPPHLMPALKTAFDMSCSNFIRILENLRPDLLIYDMLQPWAAEAALARGIPAVEFISSSGTMTSVMYHTIKLNPSGNIAFPFHAIYYRDYESHYLDELLETARIYDKEPSSCMRSFERSTNIVLIKSFREIEGKYHDFLTNISGQTIVPVGPLVQEPNGDGNYFEIIDWLEKKEKKSTVYVSFGSEYFLTKEDMEEIAYGLERSKVNFIWYLRFPKGENVKLEDVLPKGFFRRIGDRGLVKVGWAPQARILMHENTGGFISHCGWNSVLESMKYGVPIIAMPMQIDQPINARLVEEVGVGLEVVRDRKGKLHRETVTRVINMVVVEKSGEAVRRKAKDLAESIGAKGNEEIDAVVEELVKLCKKKKKNGTTLVH